VVPLTQCLGKHARPERRKKQNKYQDFSRVDPEQDPLDKMLLEADKANNPDKYRALDEEEKRKDTRWVG
jgi:hypothetical protein